MYKVGSVIWKYRWQAELHSNACFEMFGIYYPVVEI